MTDQETIQHFFATIVDKPLWKGKNSRDEAELHSILKRFLDFQRVVKPADNERIIVSIPASDMQLVASNSFRHLATVQFRGHDLPISGWHIDCDTHKKGDLLILRVGSENFLIEQESR